MMALLYLKCAFAKNFFSHHTSLCYFKTIIIRTPAARVDVHITLLKTKTLRFQSVSDSFLT